MKPKRQLTIFSTQETKQRDFLAEKYADLMEEKPEYRRLVTYVPNKKLPIYNWFKYKEGFSRELVFNLLNYWGVSETKKVFDPFAGCGTTLLACKELSYNALGMDVLPIAVFVSKVKLQDWENIDDISNAVDHLMNRRWKKPKIKFPDVKIINLAFTPEVQREILFFKEQILSFESPIQEFLMLGLISILESVSNTSKDGQFLRLIERDIPAVKDILREQLSRMLLDIRIQQPSLFKKGKSTVEIVQGDARTDPLPKKYKGKIGAIITSPPYLNRYDYSRTYSLELCMLFVEDFDRLRDIRHSLLRSHIESRINLGKEIRVPALGEILDNLLSMKLNNNRIPIMIKGYFEDMNQVIENMASNMETGAFAALVVANARFEGEMVPTDLILCELAERHGLKTESIWITRYKGNSSQQMAKYGRIPVRESIIFWSKK